MKTGSNYKDDSLEKDVKRVAVALEKLVKLLTKLIKENA